MRKESKTIKTADIARVQSYHEGGYRVNYAFAGFKSNRYFTSDRYIALDEHFNRPDGKPLKGFGLEIETECYGIDDTRVLAEVLEKIIFSHFPADLFKMQSDCSLDGDTSAECITQVMTREFIRNNYANFKLMYDTYFPAFNIKCGNSCGMHTNISNAFFGRTQAAQDECIKKLFFIVNHHFNFCCALFNRDPRHTAYSARMPEGISVDTCKSMTLSGRSSSHGVCFNLGHYSEGRIEIRLVGGQKNFPCFRNTMESIFFLCERVKTASWAECEDLGKLFAGCNQYVFDRIKSYCYDARTISAAAIEAIRPTVVHDDFI